MKSNSQSLKLFLVIAFSCISLLSSLTSVLAKPTSSSPGRSPSSSNRKPTQSQTPPFNPPSPPPGPAVGGRPRGGASRNPGLCKSVKPELTALVHYEEKGSVTNVWGLTTLERPSWLFYVPYIKEYGYPAEFVLQDQKSNIYETAIALPNRPGIVRVSLPSTAPALAVNKQYRWYFNIYCDPQKNSPPIYVEGVIQRVNLSQTITEQLKTATPIKRFAIYAQNGIWYEAVTTLLELRQKNLQDPALQAQWRDLLTSARLDNLATEPIISESGK